MVNPINAANRDTFTRRSFVTVGALGTMTLAACSTPESSTNSASAAATASSSPTPTVKFAGTVEVYPAPRRGRNQPHRDRHRYHC